MRDVVHSPTASTPGPSGPVRSGLRFSIVVPAYNEVAVLAECVASLQRQTFRGAYEVIVVDNGSTDGTASEARRLGVRVVSEPRRGVCFARQRGLSEASGEIVVSTDADCVVSSTWLQKIDEVFSASPAAVGVAGSCVYVDGPRWSEVWGRLLFGTVSLFARRTGRVVYVTATNLAFRRHSFVGYDTRLTQGGDELDVLRKLRRRGRVVYTGDNAVLTSARRLERGLVHTLVVSLCFHYLLGYAVNRVARRPLLGTAPACRAPTPPQHTPAPASSALASPALADVARPDPAGKNVALPVPAAESRLEPVGRGRRSSG